MNQMNQMKRKLVSKMKNIPYMTCILPIDEEMCQSCGGMYFDDDEETQAGWIGCDGDCGRWYHYTCAGFTRKPKRSTKFMCKHCQ